MASDFNKLIYASVKRQVEGQLALGGHQLTSVEMRKLMDVAMEQFADSLVALVASVARAQAEVKKTMDAEKPGTSQADPIVPAGHPLPEAASDPVVAEPAE